MKINAIVNPVSGGGKKKVIESTLKKIKHLGFTLEIFETKMAGDATKITRNLRLKNETMFIACGGDGTMFEVLNGLMPSNSSLSTPKLGLISAGSGNSFLRDFSSSPNETLLEGLKSGSTKKIDVLHVIHKEGNFFSLNLVSFGFIAQVAFSRNERYKNKGSLGYVLSVIKEVIDLKTSWLNLKIDEEAFEKQELCLLSVNNTKYTGGAMKIAPHATAQDGLLDVLRFGKMSRFSLLKTFPKIFSGLHVNHPACRYTQAKKISFHQESPMQMMVDGETFTLTPISIEVMPSAIEMILP